MSPKRAVVGLRLYGWIDPNPTSTKYKFEERAYSSRIGLYHARVRYRATGQTSIRTDADLAAETPAKLLALAYDAQLGCRNWVRRLEMDGPPPAPVRGLGGGGLVTCRRSFPQARTSCFG